MPTANTDLAAGLRVALGAVEINGLTRLSGGASRETWRFEADGRPLVLQRQRAGADRDMAVEVDALRAAAAAGVPTATVVAASTDDGDLGASYMVLSYVEGETIARKILRDNVYEPARCALPSELAVALAGIHRIEAQRVPGLATDDCLARAVETLDTLGEPHPTFELVLRWLAAHRPPQGRSAVVHGDFRLGNVIVGPDGLRAVVDWELVHLGDPMEDLGWLCVKAWRFGSPKPVAGVGEYAELFEAYEAAGGDPVDADVVHWWEVFGTLRWGMMCIAQAAAHLTGVSRSHELAAIGRRVCENEDDLFRALDGCW
jgi:aminoglycoside phosphotransferase (APT) family kinase protein